MLASASIMAFVVTADPARSIQFYRDVLGLRLVDDAEFGTVYDANGTHLRVQKVPAFTPHPFTALGWNVPDIRSAIGELAGRGVLFERYEFLDQDDDGVWVSPTGGRIAWFKDPDGNVLSLTEYAAA